MTGWEVRKDCGVCLGDLNGSECKRQIENDDPRLTPEQLCVLGLSEVLDRNRLNGADIFMSHAWTCVEHALSSDVPLYERSNQKVLNEAFITANNVLRNHNRHNLNEILEAISFKNYEGPFRALADKQPITHGLVYETQQNVGALITTIDDHPDFPKEYDDSIRGFMAEQTIQWLSLENALLRENPELIIYPTSPREGHSNMKAFNHDGYQVTQHGRVRIETKRSKGNKRTRRSYDKSIAYIVLEDILENTRSRRGGKVGSPRDNFLIGAIRDTLNGRESQSKRKVLQVAGHVLQKDIDRQNSLAA
ncbi:MAG: hypothetical protein ABIR46_03885 [Candidatus Saccharimonadales bacterium]